MNDMQADNEWVKVIRQTLDNYQEEYEPGAWERFDQKRNKRRRMVFLSWGSALAAVLVVGFFAAGWLLQSNNSNHQAEFTNAVSATNQPESMMVVDSSANNTVSSASKQVKAVNRFTENTSENTKPIAKEIIEPKKVESATNTTLANNEAQYIEQTQVVTEQEVITSDSSHQLMAENNQTIEKEPVLENKQATTLDQKAIDSALNAYNAPLPVIPDKKDDDKERRVHFGVNVAPGVNATQTAAAMNYGGGLNTDISLFANIQLSTGLQIEQQNINTNNQGNNSPGSELHAEMLTLDLPVNLTWQFYNGKNHSYYVSGGVSSLAYLDQKYENTNYELKLRESNTLDATKYEMTEESTTTESEVEPLETFNWGGRINFAFGFQQQLTNKLNFHVEPYVKIPVSGLGAEKIKYTTSGISCKVSF